MHEAPVLGQRDWWVLRLLGAAAMNWGNKMG